jgi:hypothetical protein
LVNDKEKEKKVKYKIGKLTMEQQEKFNRLIERNQDIFVKGKYEVGRTNVTKHGIDVGETKPIKQRARKLSQKEREIEREHIEDMLKKGIIRKSKSPWSSPVVFVPKKGGEIRFCVDYRKLNDVTKKDNHPLPKIDEMLDKFEGSKWFTSIDLASAYWQVEMEEKDIEKTAFITSEGLYENLVMPFGLCNAPATFQRLMHEVLGNLIYTKAPVYLDDIIIHSKTFEQHLQDIEEVFGKLRDARLKSKEGKCEFCAEEIKFLGHVIGKEGRKVDPDKIEKVKNYPRPENISQLRGFLGLASYYRKFIRDFSEKAKPLTELLEGTRRGKKKGKMEKERIKEIKNEEFIKQWGERQEKSFKLMKKALTETPVLIHPDFRKDFTLYTDASGFALGAVLEQIGEDGNSHPVAYGSKTLSKAERNYSTTELECYAVVWGIEKFHHYLYGRKFKVITDHQALIWLRKNENSCKGRRARWVLRLQVYDFDIIYKEGRKHKNADALSRIKDERD